MDRMSEQDAGQALEMLIPDIEIREQCFDLMASAITAAHSISPAVWEVTLDPAQVTLNVGRVYFLRLRPGEVRLVLDRGAMTEEEAAQIEHVAIHDSVKFSVIDQYVHATIPAERLGMVLPVVKRVLEPSVARCAATVTRRTPYFKVHSSGVMAYLRHVLARPIPDPDYSDVATEPRVGSGGAGALLSNDRILEVWHQDFPKPAWKD